MDFGTSYGLTFASGVNAYLPLLALIFLLSAPRVIRALRRRGRKEVISR